MKINFENLKPARAFLTFTIERYINIDCVSANHFSGNQVMGLINLQCNSLSWFLSSFQDEIVAYIEEMLIQVWPRIEIRDIEQTSKYIKEI